MHSGGLRLLIMSSGLLVALGSFIYVDNSYTSATCVSPTNQCTTIQDALDIAATSDIVVINSGTYAGRGNFNLCSEGCNFSNVTIMGATSSPEDVIIQYDMSNGTSARAVYMTGNEIVALKYLTIQDFNGTIITNTPIPLQVGGGAAVWVKTSSVTIDHVWFINNRGILGGAINCLSSNLTVTNSKFQSNLAELGGGAIAMYLSNGYVEYSEFYSNNVTSSEILATASVGGAIYALGGTTNVLGIRQSVFRHNKAERGGGAVYMESDSKTQSDEGAFFSDSVTYSDNYGNGVGTCVSTASCNTRGGALYLTVPSVLILNNTFTNNHVSTVSENNEAQGGAIYSTNLYNVIQASKGTTIDQCTFTSNNAEGSGGALYVLNQKLKVENTTFVKNNVNTVSALFTDAPSQGGAIWYSAGDLASEITDSYFEDNVAYSGWGGAIFGTETTGLLTLTHCHFLNNRVYSSYTNSAQGGAIMVASGFSLRTMHCHFQNNTALPHLQLVPLTYSGSGGAVFVQSSNVSVDDCHFYDNFALTGQFDAGSAGGALVLEDSYPVDIKNSYFKNNGAAGYYGYSSFAAPGTGGAVYVKFSAASISSCTFVDNWVSAGGSDNSIGGAVAVYFDYSSVSEGDNPDKGVYFHNTVFTNNTAYGQLCLLNGQSGEGGAVGIVGTSTPAVQFKKVNFTSNAALASQHSLLSSMGGAMSITLSSNVSAYNCYFNHNSAIQGAGNDIASVSGQNDQQNFISFQNSSFIAATTAQVQERTITLVQFEQRICSFLEAQQNAAGPSRRLMTTGAEQTEHIFPSYPADKIVPRVATLVTSLQSIYREGLNFDINSGERAQLSRRQQQQDRILHILDQLRGVDTYLLINAPEIGDHVSKTGHFTVPEGVEETLRGSSGVRAHADRASRGGRTQPGPRRSMDDIVRDQRVALGFKYKEALLRELDVYRQQRFHRNHRRASQVPEGSTPYSLSHNNRLWSTTARKQELLLAQDPERFERLFKNSLYSPNGLPEQMDSVKARLDHNLDLLTAEQEEVRNLVQVSTSYLYNQTTLRSLISFHPDIVVTSGEAIFGNPKFVASYHMFFGDYYEFLTTSKGASTDDDDGGLVSQLPSTSIIYGDILQDHLIVTVLKATLTLFSQKHYHNNFELSKLNIFNGTLYISNNITILDDSFVSDSTISGVSSSSRAFDYIVSKGITRFENKTLSNPIIQFSGMLYTGYNIGDILAFGNSIRTATTAINYLNLTQQSVLRLDSCTLLIDDKMVLDSPIDYPEDYSKNNGFVDPSIEFANVKLVLNNDALLNISHAGSLIILSDTYIKADNYSSPAIYNEGEIALLGDTESIVNNLRVNKGTGKSTSFAARGSLTSTLTVYGDFIQTTQGTLSVILNSTYSTSPVVSLYSNKSFSGALNVSFYLEPQTKNYPNLVLYSTDRSTWPVVSFTVMESALTSVEGDTVFTPKSFIEAPTGLKFAGSYAANPYKQLGDKNNKYYSQNTPNFVQTLEVTNIGCDMVNNYYAQVAVSSANQYPCYICLKNSSCSMCNGGHCGVKGTCEEGAAYTSNCCNSDCNHPYGTCQGNEDHTEFSCSCNGFFYGGKYCGELTVNAILLISSAVSIVLFAALGLYFYQRAKKQKKIVLDELRGDLLRNTEGSNNEYIQYMQQALILNDVFVKFEEIKLETKVGEGSFGVVHKATFRGAQVAVKQMRSMFLELTEKEIEEFRKEAYVMSRLRHPNIVLVMGISLVDQEPIPLPKTRSVTQQALNDSMMASAQKEGDNKKKPQKTVCIITEFLEQGSLADILYGPTRLPAEVWTYELVLTCALQAARGMLYLHSHSPPICHRDLKSSNLVVDDHWVVKVTDFGMSRIVPEKMLDQDKLGGPEDREYIGRESIGSISEDVRHSMAGDRSGHSVTTLQTLNTAGGTRFSHFSPEMTSNLGTTAWCAPELLTAASKTHYSVKVDVYSFGMVLWELWEKKRPFDEYTSRFDIMDAIRSGKRPEISANCPPSYRSLLQRCWQTNPSRRPNFTYIVRYLKDELATVKRKRGNTTAGTGMIGYRGDIFMSTSMPSYTPEQLSGNGNEDRTSTSYQEFMDNESERPSFLRRSFHAVKDAIAASPSPQIFNWTRKSNASQERTSSSSSAQNRNLGNSNETAQNRLSNSGAIMLNELHGSGGSKAGDKDVRSSEALRSSGTTAAPVHAERRGSGNIPAPQERRGSGNIPAPTETGMPANLPEGRTPLVAAFDRSLSYLAESPSPAAYMAQGGPAPIQQQQKKGPNNMWRDKYVMKMSGWKQDKPDAGLPPSMTQVQPPTMSPMVGASMPYSTPSGSVPVHRGSSPAVQTSALTSELNRASGSAPADSSATAASSVADESPVVASVGTTLVTDSPAFHPGDQDGIFDIDPDEEPLPPPARMGSQDK